MICSSWAGAQGRHHQSLGFAAGEQGAAVGPGQDPHLAGDGSYGAGVPAVDSLAGAQNVAAHDVLLQALEGLRHHGGGEARVDGLVGRLFPR